MNDLNILMTGAGAPGAVGIIKCLQREKGFHIIAADADPEAPGQYLTKEFVTIPRGDDPAFISTILDICRKKNIHVVLPLVTKELLPLASHRDEFELAGASVMVSPPASLEIANNKSRLYEFLQWRDIETPEFRVIEKAEQLEDACRELGYPGKDVTIKPSISNGSRGFRILTTQQDPLELLLRHKPGHPYVTLNEIQKILASGPMPEMLVSEFLPGEEFSVDCLCRNGEALLVIPRSREKTLNGISVRGEFIRDENIISYCTRIITELRLHGNIGFQVKKANSGRFLILEINPRVQGTISAALGAGVNLPVLAIRSQFNLPINENEMKVKWGVRFSRYWQEVFH